LKRRFLAGFDHRFRRRFGHHDIAQNVAGVLGGPRDGFDLFDGGILIMRIGEILRGIETNSLQHHQAVFVRQGQFLGRERLPRPQRIHVSRFHALEVQLGPATIRVRVRNTRALMRAPRRVADAAHIIRLIVDVKLPVSDVDSRGVKRGDEGHRAGAAQDRRRHPKGGPLFRMGMFHTFCISME